jgi:hypothetical protein
LSFSPHPHTLTKRRNRKSCQLTYRGLFSCSIRFSLPQPQRNSSPVAVNDRFVVAETWATEQPWPITWTKSEEPADTMQQEHSPGHLYSSTTSPGISSFSEQRWPSQCSRRQGRTVQSYPESHIYVYHSVRQKSNSTDSTTGSLHDLKMYCSYGCIIWLIY